MEARLPLGLREAPDIEQGDQLTGPEAAAAFTVDERFLRTEHVAVNLIGRQGERLRCVATTAYLAATL